MSLRETVLRRRVGGAFGAALLLLIGLFADSVAPTQSTFSVAAIEHPSNFVGVGTIAATMSYGTNTCVPGSAPTGGYSTDCPGQVWSGSAPVVDGTATQLSVTNTSQAPPSVMMTQQVRLDSCAPMMFADSTSGNRWALLSRGQAARGVPGPWPNSAASRFSAASRQYASSVATTNLTELLTTSFSVGAWIRTTATDRGGPIMALAESPTNVLNATSSGNPMLAIGVGGRARFDYTDSLGVHFQAIGAPINDGAWHHVVGTLTLGLPSVARLYVDGQLVVSATVASTAGGNSIAKYWHIAGVDARYTVSVANYFTGDLAGAFYSRQALTQSQIATLRNTTTAAAYRQAIPGAAGIWMLDDPVSSVYTEPVPYLAGGDPCGHVTAAVSDGTATLMPPAPMDEAAAMGWQTPVTAPGAGNTTALTFTYGRLIDWQYDVNNAAIDLLVSSSYRLNTGQHWNYTFRWPHQRLLG